MIKKLIKLILPNSLLKNILGIYSRLNTFRQYIYDLKVYQQFNGAKSKNNTSQLEGKIIAHYHVLEKGLSHPTPKNCFSLPVVKGLIKLIHQYDALTRIRSRQVDVAVEVLKQYLTFPTNQSCITVNLIASISSLRCISKFNSGSYEFTRSEFFKNSEANFGDFALSRYSVRDFTDEDVSVDLLKEVVKIAQKTPSVCNRQTAKVHLLINKKDIKNHLALQNGNRGFGYKINKLLIVSSDLYFFEGSRERNQAFVDGGMFAMSILYALHYHKIGAVALNWAYDNKQDKALHDLGRVPENEKIILFIGVGYPPDNFKVAVSDRRSLNEVMSIQ